MRWAIGILLVITFQFVSVHVHAFEIRIRGKASIDAKVNHASTMLQVSGFLRDDLKRGLRERPLKVTVKQGSLEVASSSIRTGSHGTFFYREEFSPGDYSVKIEFVGDQLLDGDSQQWTTTVQKSAVELQVIAPDFIHNPQKAILHAGAKSNGVPLIGTLRVFVNEVSVSDIVLDTAGRGGLDILEFLKPGINTVMVSLPGSAFRDEISEKREVRLAETLEISATAEERLERLRRGLGVKGRVWDKVGGVGNVPVSVVISKAGTKLKDEHVLRARTDENGVFSTFFFAEIMSDGDWDIKLTITPRGKSLSKTIEPINWNTKTERFVLNAFALIALMGALVLLFSVFKVRILNRKNKRREKRDKQRKRELAFVKDDTIIPTAFSSEEKRQVDRNAIGGIVVDVWKSETTTQNFQLNPGQLVPVQEARVEVRLIPKGDSVVSIDTYSALTDTAGRFKIELPDGNYELEVSKSGFVRGKHSFSIPHSGILSNFKVDLVPVPLKIRRLYEAITEEKGGQTFWGYKTPQEIEKILKLAWPEMDTHEDGIERKKLRTALRPIIQSSENEGIESQELLAALSSIVEESYFSGEIYTEETWLFMRNIAIRLMENK